MFAIQVFSEVREYAQSNKIIANSESIITKAETKSTTRGEIK